MLTRQKNSKEDALFAVEILTVLVLFLCMVLVAHVGARRDRLWSFGYTTATILAIVHFVISITTIGLSEAETKTTRLYYLTYIFVDLSERISNLLILGIIQRTICESSTTSLARRLLPFNIVSLVCLFLLSMASFGMYSFDIVQIISEEEDFPFLIIFKQDDVELAYEILYFMVALFSMVVVSIVAFRECSKVSHTKKSSLCQALLILWDNRLP
jgi:hypothetical protein